MKISNGMKKLVIFDFDGVLADTEEFCYKIHKDVNKTLTWQEWQDFCNGNFIEGIVNASREDRPYIIPSDFTQRYKDEIEKINVHNALHEVILSLKINYQIAVVSSTSGNLISNFLKKENLFNYFSDILGVEIDANKTTKINFLLKKYNLKPNDVIFITDTLGDILEAEKSDVKLIGVTWGLHDRKTLEKGNPITIIDDPRDLESAVNNALVP